LNYSDESYVRTYRRQTTAWKLLPWEARAVVRLLDTELDRAGVLQLDGEAVEDVIELHTGIPADVVREVLPALIKRGFYVLTDVAIFDPDFIEKESAVQSDKVRAAESRARRRDGLTSQNVTGRHEEQRAHEPRDEQPNTEPSHEAKHPVTFRDGAVTKRDTSSRENAEPEKVEQNVTQYSAVHTSTVPCRAESARTPTSLADALTMPIRERSARIVRDPQLATFVHPHHWPEVTAVAERFSEALGQGTPILGRFDRDPGVRAIVELFASGFSAEQLEQVCEAAGRDDWMRGKSLGVLTVDMARRLLAPQSPKRGNGGHRQPDYAGQPTFKLEA
jgi:hypothetical protein